MPIFTAPGAIDGLVVLGISSVAREGVEVTDGPPTQDIGSDVLAIALTDDDTDVIAARDTADLCDGSQESYDINCMVKIATGDTEIKPVRDRAFQILEIFHTALKSDRTLGGAVTQARISSVSYEPSRMPNMGLSITLTFRVHIEAFTS
jgi:hypothetical protein